MKGQTVILRGTVQRELAKALIDRAPADFVVNIHEPNRTLEQNAKLWAMLSDIARAKPEGRMMTAEMWKCVFMHACGYEAQFLNGLDGLPFPVGFRSSRMTKAQMSDFLEFITEYAARHNIQFSENERKSA